MTLTLFKASALGADKEVLSVGDGLTLPQVVSLTALDARTVRVVFSRAISFHQFESQALNPSSYQLWRPFDSSKLPVIRCDRVDGVTVDLTTAEQLAVDYQGRVSSAVLDEWGNGIDPANNEASFLGIAPSPPTATWLTSLMGLDAGIQEQLHAGFIPDLVAPALANQDPAPFETLVAQDKVIEFDMIDTESGVDVDSVKIWIEGVLAWQNDAPEVGFSGVRTPIVDGHHFAIDQLVDYAEGQTVNVRVYALDQATIVNTLDESYQFNTIGTAPYLQGVAPYSGELDVDPARHIFLDIIDPETGVDAASIWIKVNGLFAWQSQAAGPGFVVNQTSISGGFSFEITYPGGLLPTGANLVQVYAENNAENPDALSTSWIFSTQDTFPPYLTDQDPAPGATGVETTKPITFTVNDDDTVVLATVRIYVRNVLVFNGASFSAGWTQSFFAAGGVNGYSFVVVPDVSERWSEGETVVVSVVAQDAAGGELSATYDFLVGEDVFPFSIYRFLLRSIRTMDRRSPGLLQPLCEEGFDPIWKSLIFDRLTELQNTIYDPTAIDGRWLPWLKAMVGFTRELDFVASETELRKILNGAAAYWDAKPSEFGLWHAIRLVSGNRFRIRDWFDLRMMSDQTYVLELLEDFDPNVVDFGFDHLTGSHANTSGDPTPGYPEDHTIEFGAGDTQLEPFTSDNQYTYLLLDDFPPPYDELNAIREIERCVVGERKVILKRALPTRASGVDGRWMLAGGIGEWTTEVRLVDEPSGTGALNRELIKFLMEQVRNHGERIDIVYLAFLDEFLSAGDTDQWETSGANVQVERFKSARANGPDPRLASSSTGTIRRRFSSARVPQAASSTSKSGALIPITCTGRALISRPTRFHCGAGSRQPRYSSARP